MLESPEGRTEIVGTLEQIGKSQNRTLIGTTRESFVTVSRVAPESETSGPRFPFQAPEAAIIHSLT